MPRDKQGAYPNLCKEAELNSEDAQAFANFARFAPPAFKHLLTMVTPLIARKNTNFRDCISPGEPLMVKGLYLCHYFEWQRTIFCKQTCITILNP